MTDFRALCQELMDAIDSGISTERIKQSPLAIRVDAALAPPEPQGPTDDEIEERFQRWWFNEGSGIRPLNGADHEEHAHRISQIAWSNGAYVARWRAAMTKPLSPAARAVYDAVLEICPAPADEIAAAALRVAADQVGNRFIRRQILAIADELEGSHD